MRFRRYALERIGASVGVFFLAVVGTFVICHVFGPLKVQTGSGEAATVVHARLAHYANESFFDYLWRLLTGSLAQSLYDIPKLVPSSGTVPITDASLVTLSVVGWAIFIGLVIAVPLGLLWDWRPRWTRFLAWPFVYLAASLLTIWVAIELSYYLAFKWDIFPLGGYENFVDGPIDWAYHLILPAFVLCLPFAANYTRIVRATARNVRRARAKGSEAERAEAAAAATRTGLVTIAKGLLRDTGYLMGFALFVEAVFNLPGLGRTLELAIFNADTPVIESVLVFATLVALGIHLLGTLVGGAASRTWRAGA
jgi:peptide/nickel transport system permease protein